jgi:hypothetical protein
MSGSEEESAESQHDEELAYDGVCPVCGDEFTDGFGSLQEGQSREDVRVCVVEKKDGEAEALFHLPDEQTDRDPLPSHIVVGELNGVQFTTTPHTFEQDAERTLETLTDAAAVENARVVSYE